MSENRYPSLAYAGDPKPRSGDAGVAAVELSPGADAMRGRGGRTARTGRTIRMPAAASCPEGRIVGVELSRGWEGS
ncbi:MAG: hypothetical protein K2X91_10730 [Thermoleophilia bacterium]|nr:hypothetical protein [Thermoleophilia bacterium]